MSATIVIGLIFALLGGIWLGSMFRDRGDGAPYLPSLFSFMVALTFVSLAMFLCTEYKDESPFGMWSLYAYGAVVGGFLLPNLGPHVLFWFQYRFIAGIQMFFHTLLGGRKKSG